MEHSTPDLHQQGGARNAPSRRGPDRHASLEQFLGGTFHSVGQRFLRRHGDVIGLSPNFTILDAGDADAMLGDVIRSVDPGFTKNKEHPKPAVIHELFSYAATHACH